MNLSNSDLFKTFARPILRHHSISDSAEVAQPPEGIMDRIIQILVNRTTVTVMSVGISDATEE